MKVTANGKPLDLPPRSKVPDLLAYLLLMAREPIGRDIAAAQLWPDIGEEAGRAKLRRHLYRLKAWLPESNEADDWVLADRGSLLWNSELDCWVDVWQFEQRSGDPSQAEAAVELYKGDLLQFKYEEWLFQERERLTGLYIDSLFQAVRNREMQGDFRGAIEYGQQLLKQEPLREDIYRELMRLHALNGDRAGIVRYFNLCEAVLRRELEVGPSRETKEAYKDLLESAGPETTQPPTVNELAQRHNLPAPLTAFFGRDTEQDLIVRLLNEHRLITITGIGGVGKSRLALAIGNRMLDSYNDGVWWVDLSGLEDPGSLAQLVASSLGLRGLGDQPLERALLASLEPRHLLLVLDSCEGMTEGVAQFANRLLNGAPELSLLATSTEPLGFAGERIVNLQPLAQPRRREQPMSRSEIQTLAEEYPSLALFEERANAHMPTFRLTAENIGVVVDICRALDGLPLALELAAARLRLLSIEQLAARLDDRFRLLADGPQMLPARHQTLRSTLDWSHDSLSQAEQLLFRRMAVFAGGSDLAAVEQICADNQLTSEEILGVLSELVDKSLLVVQSSRSRGTRYQMLETVQAYARDKLTEAAEEHAYRLSHAEYYFSQSLEAAAKLIRSSQDDRWFDWLDEDYSNLRAALRYASVQGDYDALGHVAGELWAYWWTRGLVTEGWRWLSKALDNQDGMSPESLARAQHGAGRLRLLQGEYAEAAELLEQSLDTSPGDEPSQQLAEGLVSLGISASRLEDLDRAEALWRKALNVYQQLDDQWGVARTLNNLGDIALYQENYTEAVELLEGSRQAFRKAGSMFGESVTLINLGRARILLGEYLRAAEMFGASLEQKVLLKDKEGIAWTLEGMAAVAGRTGRSKEAAMLWGAAASLRLEIGVPIAEADMPFYQDQLAAAKPNLDRETWEQAWQEGEALGLDHAVEMARSLL